MNVAMPVIFVCSILRQEILIRRLSVCDNSAVFNHVSRIIIYINDNAMYGIRIWLGGLILFAQFGSR